MAQKQNPNQINTVCGNPDMINEKKKNKEKKNKHKGKIHILKNVFIVVAFISLTQLQVDFTKEYFFANTHAFCQPESVQKKS